LLSPLGRLRLFHNGLSLIVYIFSFCLSSIPLLSPSGKVSAQADDRGQFQFFDFDTAFPIEASVYKQPKEVNSIIFLSSKCK
jgi:hypothetical protein